METSIKTVKLTCEQVYNIWATEPELIQILDFRSRTEFSKFHIPGAKNLSLAEASLALKNLQKKLAVIIVQPENEETIEQHLGPSDAYVIMTQCQRWPQLQQPVAGHGIQATILDFQKIKGADMKNDIIFHQLFEPESSTYTYIIADKKTKEAAIIDPVLETVERDLKLIEELGLKLMYTLDTHVHADHITGSGIIKERTGAKVALSGEVRVPTVDIPLEDGQELLLGDKKIKAIETPGHTNTCMTFSFEGMVFTGDALLIRGCGRTDFQQGSSAKLYDSVHEKLFALPDDTIVYPGHDYRGQTSSTIGAEKQFNPRLGSTRSKEEFVKIMAELKLVHPKKIHLAVPANLAGGLVSSSLVMRPQVVDGIPEVTCQDVDHCLNTHKEAKVRLIDVRNPDEFVGEYGHIKNAELVVLGPDLTRFLKEGNRDEEIVFICRSGGRSGSATEESLKLGYKHTMNMVGGMIRWNALGLPVERN